jgi:hypothetical protein
MHDNLPVVTGFNQLLPVATGCKTTGFNCNSTATQLLSTGCKQLSCSWHTNTAGCNWLWLPVVPNEDQQPNSTRDLHGLHNPHGLASRVSRGMGLLRKDLSPEGEGGTSAGIESK